MTSHLEPAEPDIETDVIVIGAGPGGIASALAAAKAGARTILIDEAPAPGGHLLWEVADFEDVPQEPTILVESEVARAAADELIGTDITFLPYTAAWGIFPGPVVATYDSQSGTGRSFRATSVVIATGTADRVWPVRGWELPGFYTERQLLKQLHAELPPPGRRYALIGSGKVTDQVRAAIMLTGGAVVFESIDINHIHIDGDGKAERIADNDHAAEIDAVIQAFGQRIEPTLAIQAGAACTLHVGEAVPTPYLTPDGATTVPGIYVAGEAAGVQTARWAYSHGERVGAAAARQVAPHRIPEPIALDPATPRRPYFPPPRDPEIIIDREEGVTLAQITAAIDAGAYDINDIRRITRAGMGPSQGADSLPVIATILLWKNHAIDDDRLIARPRPPVRAVPFAAFTPLPESTSSQE